jgi:hypothetical protein
MDYGTFLELDYFFTRPKKLKKLDIQAKIDFLKWYLSVNSSEIYGKFRVFRPKKIKKINFSL